VETEITTEAQWSCSETEVSEQLHLAAAADRALVDRIVDELGARESSLIGALQGVQSARRYLPREVFSYIARKLGLSEAHVYGVATFYENFSLEPKGRFVVKVCDGTACHVRGSRENLDKLRTALGLSEEKVTTGDLGFTVETVACLGACGLAPVLTVNDKAYPAMTPEKTAALLEELKTRLEKEAGDDAAA